MYRHEGFLPQRGGDRLRRTATPRPPAPETTVVRLTTVKTIGETQIVAKDDAEAVQRLNELLW